MTLSPPAATSYATLSKQSFGKFSEFITRELGIKMPAEKLPMLQSRLQRRLRQLEMESLEDYQRHLFDLPESSPEWIEFINLVTTNKTDFFREPKHFDYLVGTALPSLSPGPGKAWPFKLWCAGCSSGEEPYTLSMVLSEYARVHSSFDFSIFATDISTRVLEMAGNAVYPEALVEPVPMDMRHRYLMRGKDRQHAKIRIVPELRQKIRFARLNFMDDDYGVAERFDVIFFRNVMIYFDRPTQQQVVRKLCRNLKPGGYLFAGHSESLVGLDLPVKPVSTSVFQKTP
jgi:chemotaxis protein methyltransferase CheR